MGEFAAQSPTDGADHEEGNGVPAEPAYNRLQGKTQKPGRGQESDNIQEGPP
ncbi:MAG: hypothetical protein U9Q78_05960 [Chloroflexota bacterium]|nr:hypothetical protein [Chloroflexota bacterium]